MDVIVESTKKKGQKNGDKSGKSRSHPRAAAIRAEKLRRLVVNFEKARGQKRKENNTQPPPSPLEWLVPRWDLNRSKRDDQTASTEDDLSVPKGEEGDKKRSKRPKWPGEAQSRLCSSTWGRRGTGPCWGGRRQPSLTPSKERGG